MKEKIKNYEIIFRYLLGSAFVISGIVIIVLSYRGLKLRFRGDPYVPPVKEQVLTVKGDNGFTDKKEAKNQLVNGLKEGKWFEYIDSNEKAIPDTNALSYRLAIYKAGKLNGIVREYYRNDTLYNIVFYKDDSIDGVEKWYYPNGKLEEEDPLTIDGKANGLLKSYDSNGILSNVIPISDNKANGIGKDYYPSGKLMAEVNWVDDSIQSEKHYSESGKELKK